MKRTSDTQLSLLSEIESILVIEHKEEFKKFPDNVFYQLETKGQFNDFCAQFKITYEKIGNNKLDFFINDLILITLLQLKFPDFYLKLANDHELFLTNKVMYQKNKNSLKFKDEFNCYFIHNKIDEIFAEHFNQLQNILILQNLKEILSHLFFCEEEQLKYGRTNGLRIENVNALSMRYIHNFNRYFDFKLQDDDISEFDFQTTLDKTSETLILDFTTWCKIEKTRNDLYHKLNHLYKLRDINKFEKVILGLCAIIEKNHDYKRFMHIENIPSNVIKSMIFFITRQSAANNENEFDLFSHFFKNKNIKIEIKFAVVFQMISSKEYERFRKNLNEYVNSDVKIFIKDHTKTTQKKWDLYSISIMTKLRLNELEQYYISANLKDEIDKFVIEWFNQNDKMFLIKLCFRIDSLKTHQLEKKCYYIDSSFVNFCFENQSNFENSIKEESPELIKLVSDFLVDYNPMESKVFDFKGLLD